MTKRNEYGYVHPNAYRTWLPEHIEVMRVLGTPIVKEGNTSTSLSPTQLQYAQLSKLVSLESLSVVYGRSPESLYKKARENQIRLYTRDEIEQGWEAFVSKL